jgi:hypothetical protein
MIHGFAGMPHLTSAAERAIKDVATDMKATYQDRRPAS